LFLFKVSRYIKPAQEATTATFQSFLFATISQEENFSQPKKHYFGFITQFIIFLKKVFKDHFGFDQSLSPTIQD